jgi:hypothetical protein
MLIVPNVSRLARAPSDYRFCKAALTRWPDETPTDSPKELSPRLESGHWTVLDLRPYGVWRPHGRSQ